MSNENRLARVQYEQGFLAERMLLPKGMDIVAVRMVSNGGAPCVEFTVRSDHLPEVPLGHIAPVTGLDELPSPLPKK